MLQTRYASFFKRLIAYLVDKLILGLLLVPLILLTIADIGTSVVSNPWVYLDLDHDLPLFLEAFLSSIPAVMIVSYIAAYIVFSWLYFALLESSSRQATLGKMLLGIFVTDERGARIGFARALGRTLAKILSKYFCYLGYIITLFTERSQALHDLLASTLVLEPDLRPSPPQMAKVPGDTAPAQGPVATPPGQDTTDQSGGTPDSPGA